jgi:hemerythrin
MVKRNYVSWSQDYSIGVDEIDRQHKDLLNLINYVINHCTGNEKEEKDFFDGIIENVIKHLKEHFSTEEKIMKKTNYPAYNEHKEKHTAMLNELAGILEKIEEGKIALNLFELTDFLKNWILDHIPTQDKKASEYFQKGYEGT